MRVGITTCHRAHNYGAMLQAYALKRYLESKGHNVYMTDTRAIPLTQWHWPLRESSLKSILLYPKKLIKWYLPSYLYLRRREENFERFRKRYLDTQTSSYDLRFDAIFYGSDQIWSKYKTGFDVIRFGFDNLNSAKRIALSASMGVIDIQPEDIDFLSQAFQRFDAISVRELPLKEKIDELHIAPNKEIICTIDPTFLLKKEDWLHLVGKRKIGKPYLLFYDFQDCNIYAKKIVKEIAKRKNLMVIRITDGVIHSHKEIGYERTAGPKEFLNYLYYADFVVSTSFHGTAFSLIFEKQFYSSQVWNTDRVQSLLSKVGLSHRFLTPQNFPENIDIIDYAQVDKVIQTERLKLEAFINDSLNM